MPKIPCGAVSPPSLTLRVGVWQESSNDRDRLVETVWRVLDNRLKVRVERESAPVVYAAKPIKQRVAQ